MAPTKFQLTQQMFRAAQRTEVAHAHERLRLVRFQFWLLDEFCQRWPRSREARWLRREYEPQLVLFLVQQLDCAS